MGDRDLTWIVDPLDGTVNFYHGLPLYCTSIGCMEGRPDALLRDPAGHRVVAAALYSAPLDRLYVGIRGGGATLNGRPLILDPVTDLASAVVSVSMSVADGSLPLTTRLVDILAPRARKVRSLGSTALELAMVASGELGAFLRRGTNLWNFGAARLLVEEAGGHVDLARIRPGRWQIVAAAPGVYDDARAIADAAGAPRQA